MRLDIYDRKMWAAKIYLNGKRQRWVIAADEEQGYIERYELDDYGALVFRDGKVQTVRVSGVVRIELEG